MDQPVSRTQSEGKQPTGAQEAPSDTRPLVHILSMVLAGDWPLTSTRNRVGARIRELIEAGSVRHDILVDRSNVGRIIGQRGSTLGALLQVASTPHQPQPQPQPRPSFGPSLSFSRR